MIAKYHCPLCGRFVKYEEILKKDSSSIYDFWSDESRSRLITQVTYFGPGEVLFCQVHGLYFHKNIATIL